MLYWELLIDSNVINSLSLFSSVVFYWGLEKRERERGKESFWEGYLSSVAGCAALLGFTYPNFETTFLLADAGKDWKETIGEKSGPDIRTRARDGHFSGEVCSCERGGFPRGLALSLASN